MNCPFTQELNNGTMVCDSLYEKVAKKQCPTAIFNQCQKDANDKAMKTKETR